jgi:hypothetical protein
MFAKSFLGFVTVLAVLLPVAARALNLTPQESEYRALALEILKAPLKTSRSKVCRKNHDPGVQLLCAYARTLATKSNTPLLKALSENEAIAQSVMEVDIGTGAEDEGSPGLRFGGSDFGTDILRRLISELKQGDASVKALEMVASHSSGDYGEAVDDELCRMYVRMPADVLAQWPLLKQHNLIPPFPTTGDCDAERMKTVLLPVYNRACKKTDASVQSCRELRRLLKRAP